MPRITSAAIEPTTSTKTRISYAYDIRIFFHFLRNENPILKNKAITCITVDILDSLQSVDIEEYQEYLKVYDDGGRIQTNGERGLKRKMSALRSFYAYFYKREMIRTNPTLLVDMPKLHDKEIIRLDNDETAELLDYIEHCGDRLTGQKKVYYEKTKLRDLAIVTLLLGTGLRVSECVGLDVGDIDFKNGRIRIVRKGGSETMVYFGSEVEKALLDYLEARSGLRLLPDTKTHSSTLPNANVSVSRQLRIWLKNMRAKSRLQRKLHLISCEVHTVLRCTEKPAIFIS